MCSSLTTMANATRAWAIIQGSALFFEPACAAKSGNCDITSCMLCVTSSDRASKNDRSSFDHLCRTSSFSYNSPKRPHKKSGCHLASFYPTPPRATETRLYGSDCSSRLLESWCLANIVATQCVYAIASGCTRPGETTDSNFERWSNFIASSDESCPP